MKQVLQSLADGRTDIVEVPAPRTSPGSILIQTTRSLISSGTERMLVDFGRATLISKAKQQPNKVRQVLEKVSTDGLWTTLDAVRSKLDQPIPLGYCNVGVVQGVGAGVSGFSVGDRVSSNGPHAEMVAVPKNLCAHVPEGVSDDTAAFAVIGSIGLQGVRLAQPTLGECFVVTGLGLIGLMTAQLLRIHGCRVLGIDMDKSRLDVAQQFGFETVNPAEGEDPVVAAERFSRGRGVDGVLLTLAAKSSQPVNQAAQMCRRRGRIVLVGVTELQLSRADFYEKELSFQVSCSYGPGRYDPNYETKGQDYPVGFVRWTEQRNFEAVLDMMEDGRLDVTPLISHRFSIDRGAEAYNLLVSNEPSLGILLEYPSSGKPLAGQRAVVLSTRVMPQVSSGTPRVSFIGAGNYGGRILMPAFHAAGVAFSTVVTRSGVGSTYYGKKYGFVRSDTNSEMVFSGDDDVVVIATRHDTHAELVVRALEAGKHVFVEKPLALTLEEVNRVEQAANAARDRVLMVGFNRRFAPQVIKMKALLDSVRNSKTFVITVNAGAIPPDHWTQDPQVGGGRIIGEACHFIDLLRFLAGSPIISSTRLAMGAATGDTVSLQLGFADGSIGTVHYFANGSKAFPKERLEVFAQGRILQLDNFRRLKGFGWSGFSKMNLWQQDKGQKACVAAFLQATREHQTSPIPFEEISEVNRVSIQLATNS
ncbi:MAG TPA: dehydrogenase [Nitrospirales bacterium]|nr:dehydrogenase [Nitrospirales bacterium]HIB54447.1 dehydrogenase [Nitrospirales bacterium]HIC05254.1 dehydrogenase [Nitrospirales bacterium]